MVQGDERKWGLLHACDAYPSGLPSRSDWVPEARGAPERTRPWRLRLASSRREISSS